MRSIRLPDGGATGQTGFSSTAVTVNVTSHTASGRSLQPKPPGWPTRLSCTPSVMMFRVDGIGSVVAVLMMPTVVLRHTRRRATALPQIRVASSFPLRGRCRRCGRVALQDVVVAVHVRLPGLFHTHQNR